MYWHAMALAHSRYILDGFDNEPSGCEVLAIAPVDSASTASIFKVGPRSEAPLRKAKFVQVNTYRVRDTWCRLSEWLKHIRSFQPDIIVVLDEAASANALLAGVVNGLLGRGVVLFYGFENIVQYPGWRDFLRRPTLRGGWNCIRRTARFAILDWMLMPLRRRLIHGGLVSYQECADVIKAMGFDPPMSQQWWAVNDNTFVPDGPKAEFGLGDRYVFGFVGRFTAEKGILDLVRALAALGEEYALVLVGDGPLAAAIRSLADELRVADRIRLLPPQDQTQLAASYRAMNLVVLPSHGASTWKEQYGRVLMEAMQCGVAVAGSGSGAIPAVLQDPAAVFPEGDVGAIVAVIEHLRANPPRAEDLRRRCAGTGAEDFASAWIRLGRDILLTTARRRQAAE